MQITINNTEKANCTILSHEYSDIETIYKCFSYNTLVGVCIVKNSGNEFNRILLTNVAYSKTSERHKKHFVKVIESMFNTLAPQEVYIGQVALNTWNK